VCDRPFEELDDALGGDRFIPPNVPPIITVPTTAGTGSEVGRSGVLTVKSTGRKTVIFSPFLLAKAALLDPELTRSMPAQVTAATGFDALTHCIEAYLSLGDHPMADAIALGGIDLAAKFLERAVNQGADLEARGAMMKAAMMGAVAFQKGLGACHSLAHPLSSEHGLHHGLANALCLPAVLEFNAAVVPDKVLHVGLLLGGAATPGACQDRLVHLRKAVGLPNGLADVGISESALGKLATLALMDACHQSNPRPCSEADLLALYRASL
jgi:alcohol dehydrogenase class IV